MKSTTASSTSNWAAELSLILLLSSSSAYTSAMQIVETRLDNFGGTGLYAKKPFQVGDTLTTMTQDDVLFAGYQGETLVGQVIGNLFESPRNWLSDSCSIAASLATWKLLQDHKDEVVEQEYNRKIMPFAGISPLSAEHAANLPWEKARWQLPLLWPREVLDSALKYGQAEALLSSTSTSTSATSSTQEELDQVCKDAKGCVENFQLAAVRLADELGPELRDEYTLLSCSDQDISLACHQAMAMVFSRTFLHQASGETTMLPVIDQANHNVQPNAGLKSAANGGVLLVAKQDIEEDEEITITYGLEDGGTVLSFSGYGFVPPGMAEESAAGKALQLAGLKGQEIVKQQLEREQLHQNEQPKEKTRSRTATKPAFVV